MDNGIRILNRINEFAEIVSKAICTDGLRIQLDLELCLTRVMENLYKLRANGNTLYIIGNGGSAAIASHALVDFINVAKIHAQVLHESSLLTCMANDYDYQHAYSRVLETFMRSEDMLIAISSSGKSLNICNAVEIAKNKGSSVITFSGFDDGNPLRKLGDINFWLDSHDYGYVEVGHQFILHNLSDRFALENMRLKKINDVNKISVS